MQGFEVYPSIHNYRFTNQSKVLNNPDNKNDHEEYHDWFDSSCPYLPLSCHNHVKRYAYIDQWDDEECHYKLNEENVGGVAHPPFGTFLPLNEDAENQTCDWNYIRD